MDSKNCSAFDSPQNDEKLKVEMWPVERLVEYARNPRKNDEQVERMKAAIKEFGFRIPVVAKSDGTLVDGHLRLKAARALGLKEVPVALADELTGAQVKAFRLLANQSANWAEWDFGLLKLEIEDLKTENFNVDMIGFDRWMLDGADPSSDVLDGDGGADTIDGDSVDDFEKLDENLKTDYKCPKCGYEW